MGAGRRVCLTGLSLFLADVHNAEFVLTGVLTQTLDYDSYPLGRRGWAPCPGAPRPGHAAGRPAASRGLFSRVGALPPPVFRSESPSCAAFPCGRKTGHKAHLSRLWVTAQASSCLQPEGGCGRRPGPQGLAGALQGEAGPGPRCGWAALLWVVFLNTPTYKFN